MSGFLGQERPGYLEESPAVPHESQAWFADATAQLILLIRWLRGTIKAKPARDNDGPGDRQKEMAPTLYTIGYERATLDDLLLSLQSHSIDLLIDVREAPVSRKRAFSKGALAQALQQVAIDYLHLRALGNPKPGRDAAKRGDLDTYQRIFTAHLAGEAAQTELNALVPLLSDRRVCLLCLERDHSRCHRAIVADALSARSGAMIEHLLAGR